MENDLIGELGEMILKFDTLRKTEADRHSTYLPKGINISASYGEIIILLRKELYEMLDLLEMHTEMEEEEVIELIIYNGIKSIYNALIEKEKINNAT